MHAALLHQAIHRLHLQIPRFYAAEEEDFSTWTEAFHLATLSDRCVPGKRQHGLFKRTAALRGQAHRSSKEEG